MMLGFIVITVLFIAVVQLCMHLLLSRALDTVGYRLARLSLLLNSVSMIGMGVSFSAEHKGLWQGTAVQAVSVWLMFQLFVIAMLAVYLAARYIYRKNINTPVDASRRHFAKALAAVPCAAAGASLYGSFVEKDSLVVRSYSLPVQGLGKRLQGYRIAQLSDVHLGPFFDLQALRNLLDKTAAEKPDVLVITGDLFDDASTTIQAAKLLDSYADSFPQGIFYCRGNHEHFRGIALVEIALANTRVHNLVNSCELVMDDERPLYIAGVDYPMEREQFDFLQEAYTEQAMAGIPAGAVKVLLAHHPAFFDTAAKYDTELVLSGHTHGGQLGFFGLPLAPPIFRYMRGWYRQAHSALYVHCGNGSWFPFRLGCPPEIAVFRLQAAE